MPDKPTYAELEDRVAALEKAETERDAARQMLKASEERFQMLYSRVPMPYQSLDEQGNLLEVNPAWLSALGYCREEVIGRPFSCFLHPDWQDHFRENFPRFKAVGEVMGVEFEMLKRDGTTIPVSFTGRIGRDMMGRFQQTHCIFQDISERRQSERELKASHQRFLTVLDSIDATVYVVDIDTHEVLFMNQYMKEQFGRDMTGKSCYSAFRNSSVPCSFCPIPELRDGDGSDVCIWQNQNSVTGRWYINHDRIIPWTGNRRVKLQIATDVTMLKQMEEELRQSHKMESIGTLAGGMAHDFNNILGIIMGNAELALDDTPQWSPVAGYLKEIKTAGLRARDVVHQLLSFSRKNEVARESLDLAEAVQDALTLVRSSLPSSIDLKTEMAPACPAVLADATQIHQVVINLCTNAAHALPDHGGEIRVRVVPTRIAPSGILPGVPPGHYLELRVSDTGSGMSPDVREKIFDPYFTTKEVGKGTGMGLSLVHGIVKNHNGHIVVESEPDKGSRFSLFFPVTEGLPGEENNTVAAPGSAGTVPARILVVDDEAAIVNIMGQYLRRLGFDVDARTCPETALELFTADPDRFDLVISDVTMPKMSGISLGRKIKQIRPGTPVVVCTGHSPFLDDEGTLPEGVDACVMKPVTREKIAGAIDRVLGGRT